eukprot:COSAG06_NODE_5239_length_3617_cov_1.810972_3_plen_76_part_00
MGCYQTDRLIDCEMWFAEMRWIVTVTKSVSLSLLHTIYCPVPQMVVEEEVHPSSIARSSSSSSSSWSQRHDLTLA